MGDPNADIRTRYRSKVYSEQCVQSKHREMTNYYIGTTVAFIAYYISDLVFLEGQVCILTVTPFCVLSSFLLWSLGGIKKNLGILLTFFQEKKPFPQKFPRNRRSDGGRFVVEQSKPCPYNSNRQSCHPLTVVLLPAPSWSKSRSTDPVTKDCRKSPPSQSTVTRHL